MNEIDAFRMSLLDDVQRIRREQAVLVGIANVIDSQIDGLLRIAALTVGVGATDAPAAELVMRARFAAALVHARAAIRCARQLGYSVTQLNNAVTALRQAVRLLPRGKA